MITIFNRSCHDSSLESQRQLIETLLHEKTKADAGTNHPNEPGSGNSPQFTMMAEPIQATSHGFSPDSEIDKYHNLVRSLLKEIDACQAILPQDRHVRIRDGVLAIHEAELAIFLDSHGEAAMRTFDSPLFKVRIKKRLRTISSNNTPRKQDSLTKECFRGGSHSSLIKETIAIRPPDHLGRKLQGGLTASSHLLMISNPCLVFILQIHRALSPRKMTTKQTPFKSTLLIGYPHREQTLGLPRPDDLN